MGSLSFQGVMVAALPGSWDVTVTDTVAPSYLSISSACAASAAKAAAKRKEENYFEISCNHHHFFPIAFETFGPINQVGVDFISALGHRISTHTDDPRESFFLFNAFPILSSALMPSVSPIRSAISRWKCDVTSRDKHSSCFVSFKFLKV